MGVRQLVAMCIVVALIQVAVVPAMAQSRLNVMVCKEIRIADLGASGSRADPFGCGREFLTSQPYVVLFSEVLGVTTSFEFRWELLDPSDAVYSKAAWRISPGTGYSWNYTIWNILPVATTEKELVEKNQGFRGHIVEVGATPVSQIPGEWKLKVTMTPGSSAMTRFTLKP